MCMKQFQSLSKRMLMRTSQKNEILELPHTWHASFMSDKSQVEKQVLKSISAQAAWVNKV